MKKWQLIYDGVTSEKVRFGLSQISDVIFRYAGYKAEIRTEETEHNAVVLGIIPDATDLPPSGFRLRVEAVTDGRQRVTIDGADETALMYGCMEFAGNYLSQAHLSHTVDEPYFFRNLFSDDPLPMIDLISSPAIPRRGLWLWGHTMYDYRGFFENMARLKLNEIILWNDYAPSNGREIVAYAHSLGIRVIWGYSWGWDTKMVLDVSEESSDAIIAKYEAEYAQLGGDGIYFQSFTETERETLDGQIIAKAVVEFVNRTARKLLNRHPGLLLQFGLHAQSVKNRLEYIAQLDPRVHIVWENCGDFPYHAMADRTSEREKTHAFTERILSLRPNQAATGAVFKSMIQLKWSSFKHQTEASAIGNADEATIQRRKKETDPIWHYLQGEWIAHGDLCLDIVRKWKGRCGEIYALVEDGVFERDIRLPVALLSEMLWDCDRPYEEILRTTVEREDVTLK